MSHRLRRCSVLLVATLGAASAAAAPPPLHAHGAQLVTPAGTPVRLRGVNVASLEWGDGEPNAQSNPRPCWQGQSIADTVAYALSNWHANVIRLPINPDRWWSAVGNDGAAYRARIDQLVQQVREHDAYIVIDLHWSDGGQWGQNQGQHNMPDANTQTVLADVAAHFADDPAVLIGVYNEPHDVDWNTWRNGGQVNEGALSYATPGLQAMVRTARQAGAHNVLLVGGLGWAYDLTGVVQGFAIDDDNVAYDAHVYPFKGGVAEWDANVSVAAGRVPVFIGEFGAFNDGVHDGPWHSGHDFVQSLTGWVDAHGYAATAWTMAPVAPPTLLGDWCYSGSWNYGAFVQEWLAH